MCSNARKDGNRWRRDRPTCIDVRMLFEKPYYLFAAMPLVMLVCACTVIPPNQPTVLALPGSGKSFEQFNADNNACKQFANEQVDGQTPDSVALDSGARSAALGTILGAAAGAAINGGHGAAVGAGSGLAIGGLAGTDTAAVSTSLLQQRYDFGYIQCMYAKGHRVPVGRGDLMDDFFYGRYGSYVEPPPGSTDSIPQ